jgi:hypothetical protein
MIKNSETEEGGLIDQKRVTISGVHFRILCENNRNKRPAAQKFQSLVCFSPADHC